jgi:ribokinase
MSRIIVLGSINMDVVVTAPRHPQLGETIFGDAVHFIPGGKGCNQSVAAKRLGGEVTLIGRLGKDGFGATMHSFLSEEGIDLAHLKMLEQASTGTALITVSHDSENTIVVVSGANTQITPEEVSALPLDLGPDDVVVSQFEIPQAVILSLFARAREVGATTILNTAPAAAFIPGLLPLVSVLILNETELAFLTNTMQTDNIDDLARAARSLQAMPEQKVIVTIGARGALYITADTMLHVPSPSVKAIDTTGAGDCFVGALAVALAEQQPIEAGLTFANTAASISVQRLGAAVSVPMRSEVDKIVK